MPISYTSAVVYIGYCSRYTLLVLKGELQWMLLKGYLSSCASTRIYSDACLDNASCVERVQI